MPRSSQILRRLVRSGAVVEESRRSLGFTLRRHTTTPATGREELVERLRSVLLGESVPDGRTTTLVAVLGLAAPWRLVVDKEQVKQASRRARMIRDQLGDDERAILSPCARR